MMDWSVRFYGLIFECPFEENDKNCPFHEIRKQPIEERLRIIHESSSLTLSDLERRHVNCISKRERARCTVTNDPFKVLSIEIKPK